MVQSLFVLLTVCVYFCCPTVTSFKRIIPDDGPAAASPEKVKRIVFCTGKIYYELTRERKNRGMDDTVAVVRIEQVTSECRCCVVQEEGKNCSAGQCACEQGFGDGVVSM